MVARIYRPARTATQAGEAKTDKWLLVYEPASPLWLEPLMGYTASSDMKRQIRLFFDSREEAVAYAERNGIPYQVYEPREKRPKRLSYADNFRYDRSAPWTH